MFSIIYILYISIIFQWWKVCWGWQSVLVSWWCHSGIHHWWFNLKKNIFLLIFFSESKLGVNLTLVPEFHSHLESMASLTRDQLMSHISVSYLLEQGTNNNVVSLDEPFPQSIDPTRYYQMIIMQTLNAFISDFIPCFVTCSVQSFVLNIETWFSFAWSPRLWFFVI